jgi:cell wall-associated NlpC family hydrolase
MFISMGHFSIFCLFFIVGTRPIFSRTNFSGEMPDYGNPGSPMGDVTFEAMFEEAKRHLGKRYVFGASGPNTFDCSGFVSYVINQSGVASVGRQTAQGLYNLSRPISPSEAKPGDLIFFTRTYSTTNTVTHVGIVLEGGKMIHTGGNPAGVEISSYESTFWRNHFYSFCRLN